MQFKVSGRLKQVQWTSSRLWLMNGFTGFRVAAA